ncbi:MAG: signal peptidase I [Holophagaceae bacterium]|nr:signal peptidase I [Holophagaceae bacterium]
MAKENDKKELLVPAGATKGMVRDNLEMVCGVLILIFFLKTFVAQNFTIPSASMRDTMMIGDHLVVNKFIFAVPQWDWESKLFPMRKVERGDIIVFRYPLDREQNFVKRCVAMPGDIVEFRNKRLYINGELKTGSWEYHTLGDLSIDRGSPPVKGPWPVDRFAGIIEPAGSGGGSIWAFIDPEVQRSNHQGMTPMMGGFRDFLGPITVPPGHVMAVGDNRDNSSDSRYWGFLPIDHMRGRPFMVWWSFRENGTDFDNGLVPNGPVEVIKNIVEGMRHFFPWTRWERTGHIPR